MDLIALAKECPEINITLKTEDLLKFANYCISNTRKELEQQIADANTETYQSAEQVAKILDVSKTTLWRWSKQGYLAPVEIGGKRRYRMSDIRRILDEGKPSRS